MIDEFDEKAEALLLGELYDARLDLSRETLARILRETAVAARRKAPDEVIGLNGELWRGKASRSPDGTLCLDGAVKIGGYGEGRLMPPGSLPTAGGAGGFVDLLAGEITKV